MFLVCLVLNEVFSHCMYSKPQPTGHTYTETTQNSMFNIHALFLGIEMPFTRKDDM